jgi:hypothetical protein
LLAGERKISNFTCCTVKIDVPTNNFDVMRPSGRKKEEDMTITGGKFDGESIQLF